MRGRSQRLLDGLRDLVPVLGNGVLLEMLFHVLFFVEMGEGRTPRPNGNRLGIHSGAPSHARRVTLIGSIERTREE